jgi:sugar diacid utilization regulator
VAQELQQLADGLARTLGRAVTVDDPRLRLLAYSRQPTGAVDPARVRSILERETPPIAAAWVLRHIVPDRDWSRLPPAPEHGFEVARIGVPIRGRGTVLGYVWLLEGDEPMADEELAKAVDMGRSAAVVMQRDRSFNESSRTRARQLLRDLLDAADDDARATAAGVILDADLFVANEPVLVVVVAPGRAQAVLDDADRAALDAAIARASRAVTPRRVLAASRLDHAVLVISARDHGAGRGETEAVVSDLSEALEKEAPGIDGFIGVGRVVDGLADAPRSYQQARHAATVARQVRTLGRVVRHDALGVYAVLAALPDGAGVDLLPAGLVRLLHCERGRESFLTTIECYLDHAGDARATSVALAVHRATLYYRLRRAEELGGIDLSDGAQRLAMHVGIKLARLTGMLRDEQ